MMRILEIDVRHSLYHKVLRVLSLVFLFVLLFESGLVHQSTAQMSVATHQYLANAVGATASIEPTELNSLTAELTAQKLTLQQREEAVADREIEVGLAPGEPANQKTVYLLAAVLSVLLVLIVINYVLDFLRLQEFRRLRTLETV
jgi:hypothetical protein